MGFSSHALELKVRDKLNKRYLKKGNYFRLKKEFLEASVREGINIKSASPDQLKQIKISIRKRKEKERKQKYKAIIGSLLIGLVIFYLIGQIIQYTFF